MAYAGEFVFTFLFDLGGEIRMSDATRLLATVETAERIEPGKSAPSYVQIVRPLTLRYAPRKLETTHGAFDVAIEAHVYAIGAIAVVLRLPFRFASIREVNDASHLRPREGANFEGIAREIMGTLEPRMRASLVETYDAPVEPEPYQVIVLTETDLPARELFTLERQALAGLVAGERRPERLSADEVADNLRTWFSYYQDDLVVADWERALVIEPSGKYDDVLSVMESANLELLELRAYDRYLDLVLERAYDDLTRFYGRGGLFRSARNIQEELSEARIDFVRVTDSINNIGKIFGDYYLAKLHVGLTERFHLSEWESIVREKMQTLNELYTLASHEVEHRRGMALESIVVVLFIMDLVLIYLVSRH
ncbi:MAG: hypothetical protein QOE90_960 [Thermoplasmata archaeon]|jgi:hypothetical protein|nr:hypothetical protein [Thermoplasmata archaeon]